MFRFRASPSTTAQLLPQLLTNVHIISLRHHQLLTGTTPLLKNLLRQMSLPTHVSSPPVALTPPIRPLNINPSSQSTSQNHDDNILDAAAIQNLLLESEQKNNVQSRSTGIPNNNAISITTLYQTQTPKGCNILSANPYKMHTFFTPLLLKQCRKPALQ